ncbi:MAG: tetratricopeptide repeat-containing protein [Planctomycetota bacterium]
MQQSEDVRGLLRIGEHVAAWDAAGRMPDSREAVLLRARALQGLGARGEARALLQALPPGRRGGLESERLGLLASLAKADALELAGAERQAGLEEALAAYERAARAVPGSPWHPINVATLAAVLGDGAKASRVAGEVIALCDRLERRGLSGGDAYWVPATRGEALLVAGRHDEARDAYAQAARRARRQRWWSHLGSTLRNASLVLHDRPEQLADLRGVLAVPPVLVVTGHLVDLPGRTPPRFPARRVPAVDRALRAALAERLPSVGVSGGAAGADLLFQRALAARRIPSVVVLPQEGPWFVERSVEGRAGGDWLAWHRRAVRRAHPCLRLVRHGFPDEGLLFEYANEVQEGYARERARQLGTSVELLAVWDGKTGDGRGGTADFVERFARAGADAVRVIDPARPGAGARPLDAPRRSRPRAPATTGRALTAALCFADVHGYSLLDEDQVLAFVEEVLPRIARRLDARGRRVLTRNSWGDAVFAAFTDVAVAADFALDLVRLFAEAPWPAGRLPADLGVRVALHAAPVHRVHDALLGRTGVTGAGVSHAARYEPVTPIGRVYASAPFVALLHARHAPRWQTTYAGQLELPKGHGLFPAWDIRQSPLGSAGSRARTSSR